ncbi:hypothetical protein ACP26L_25640 [Paenibacillus sp. S-38]|uniref:hypothetical protein n=1 Tax=Paenibacillus sp. S-38 TaxID=3416710 RepID=UPI003CEC8FB7
MISVRISQVLGEYETETWTEIHDSSPEERKEIIESIRRSLLNIYPPKEITISTEDMTAEELTELRKPWVGTLKPWEDAPSLGKMHVGEAIIPKGGETTMEELAVGRLVHYVMPDGKTHRPAMVVQVWNKKGMSNLQVFTDGQNDYQRHGLQFRGNLAWVGSVSFSEGKEANTWHWPERA